MQSGGVALADKRALVAVCHNGPMVFSKTAQSLVEFGWGDRIPYCREQLGFEAIQFCWFGSAPRVDMLRNKACHAAVNDGFTHLLFLDADMIWPETTIYDMLRHADREAIVAGLYYLKGPPFGPVHLVDRFQERGVDMFYRANDYGTDLVPVQVVGMGCTLIPVSCLKAMGDADWFYYKDDADGWPIVSEDVPFSLRAAELGYGVYMDPTVKCGHVGVTVTDERHHIRYQDSIEHSKTAGPLVTVNEAVS
jgi:hypothetical protein